MRNKGTQSTIYNSRYSGELICSTYIRGNDLMIVSEGEEIMYEEPIPNYMLSNYDERAKGGISTLRMIPIMEVQHITIDFIISPTNEKI